MVDDQSAITEPNHAYEKPDAGAHGDAQIPGDADEHPLPESGDGQDHKQDACNEHRTQCGLPRVPHIPDDGVGEERIQPHARGETHGPVGVEPHKEAGQCSGDAGGNERSALVHTCRGHHLRVHKSDVGHRHKRGEACAQLDANGGI